MRRSISTGAGIRLKKIREELKMTQEEMAEVLDLTPRYVAQIEAGSRNMSAATLYYACEKLSISADYLFLGRTDRGGSESIVLDMLKNLDPAYLPLAEDLLKTFILAVNKSKDS